MLFKENKKITNDEKETKYKEKSTYSENQCECLNPTLSRVTLATITRDRERERGEKKREGTIKRE